MSLSKTNVDYEQVKKDRISKTFIWACFFLYILMMGSKNSYTAEIVEIMTVFDTTKARASLAMTYYFVTYAVAQIILTFIMGKINLRIYLGVTAGVSAILTILIGYMNTIEPVYALCAVNGIMQAGIYSGCMQALSRRLEKRLLPLANKIMGLGTSVASLISYAVPALFVGLGRWDLPFKVLGILFLLSAIFFIWAYTKIKKYPPVISTENGKTKMLTNEKAFIELPSNGKKVMFFIFMACLTLIGNTTYYSTFNWIPNLLYEEFSMPKSFSIFLTLLFPVVNAFVSIGVVNLCEKFVNILAVSFSLMIISLCFFLPMTFVHNVNIVLTLVCMVVFIALGSGARQVFSSILAFKMRTQISSGGYLAFTNAFAALAAGVMPTLSATIIDSLGYQVLFIIVFAVGLLYATIVGVWSLMHTGKIARNKNK